MLSKPNTQMTVISEDYIEFGQLYDLERLKEA